MQRRAPVFVTGGAGFIGSALVRALIADGQPVVTVDKLTYAGSLTNLQAARESPLHQFEQTDICNAAGLAALFERWRPSAVYHLAAETHVDRSIEGPSAFVETNITGTTALLQSSLAYWRALPSSAARMAFRVLIVSTDEVYGDLGESGYFTEESPYRPRSPYAASKAAADHLARAWHATYGLPTIVSNCGNNFGPFQFPEKLIPLAILNALERRPIPIYGDGQHTRDWIHVDDHVAALRCIMERGVPGQSYLVGARTSMRNVDVVRAICEEVWRHSERAQHTPDDLVVFVADRPGHDRRYVIDPARIEQELGWKAVVPFRSGLAETVGWYAANSAWCAEMSQRYDRRRLGLSS